jgi:hypothetical protein
MRRRALHRRYGHAKAGLRVVYRMPTGGLVWAIPNSSLQILWAGPNSSRSYYVTTMFKRRNGFAKGDALYAWHVGDGTWWLGPVRLHEIATGQQVRS